MVRVMAGSLNKVTLIGNVGKDPEIRSTQDGREVASFSLATSESWKDKSGERKERTEWHRVVIFSAIRHLAFKFAGTCHEAARLLANAILFSHGFGQSSFEFQDALAHCFVRNDLRSAQIERLRR